MECPGGGHPSIDATYDMSPVECSAVQYNPSQPNQNVIVFRDDAWPHPGQFNTLGLTRLKYGLTTGEIFDADMEINSTDDHKLIVDGVPAEQHLLRLATAVAGGAIVYGVALLALARRDLTDLIGFVKRVA